MSKLLTYVVLFALIGCLLPCWALAGVPLKPSQSDPTSDYRQIMQRIDAVRTSNDNSTLPILAQEIQSKWSNADIIQYSALINRFCYVTLLSTLGKQDEGTAIVSKYALLALARKEEMSVTTEANLVNYLQPQERKILSNNTLSSKDWENYRNERASISLHLLGRISRMADRTFDFSRIPDINVTPPPGANFPSGTSPDDVTDPKLRAEYEASIKANEAFNSKRNEQLQLKELNETLVPLQQKYVVDLYSMKPYNLPELKNLMSKYQLTDAAKQRVIDQVTANMASGNHS